METHTYLRRLGNAGKGPKPMMHFTCDQCGKEMRAAGDARYSVKIEVQSAGSPVELTDEDLDDDHMETLSELLRELEDGAETFDLPPPRQEFHFDLCPDCRDKFVQDPLAKEHVRKLRFSKN